MTVLQNILYPSEATCTEEQMYYHRSENRQIYDGYFNLFSLRKWRKYTDIQNFRFHISGTGSGKVVFYSEKGELFTWLVGSGQSEESSGNSAFERDTGLLLGETNSIASALDHQYLWFSWEPLTPESRIDSAYYYTTDAEQYPVKLALDICTFRREAYVERNLQVLKDAVLENPASPIHGKVAAFVIDNGQTLEEERFSGKDIHLFRNVNAGGSGGFARGMMEILQAAKTENYTHVILLDDDAVLEPEAFVRTYGVLSHVKETYKKSCVAGAMLDLYERTKQNELGASYNNGTCLRLGGGLQLTEFDQVRECDGIEEMDYAGWWYACYPIGVVSETNLPMPFFIHYDDMDYGLRNRNGHITMNGICIWHEGPDRKQSQALVYYGIRNRLICNALHTDVTLKDELNHITNAFLFDTLRCQYETAELILEAVKDFIEGPGKFVRIDPVEKNNHVRAMAGQFVPFEQLSDDADVVKQITDYAALCEDGHTPEPTVSKNLYIRTLNGWILPAKRFNRKKVCCFNIFQPDMRGLFRQKKAVLVDPYSKKGIWVERSYAKAWHCVRTYLRVRGMMNRDYRKAAEAYRNQYGRMTEVSFWKQYLKRNTKGNM